MYKYALILTILLGSITSKADLGTDPVNYSCDEMYYSFYYDYEKLRSLWPKFQKASGSCNERLINWINNDEKELRENLGYSVLDKENIISRLKFFNILPKDATKNNLKQKSFLNLLGDYGLPDLITHEELKELIEEQKSINGSYLNRNNEKSWHKPVLGQGAGNISRFGYFRIDQIGAPMNLPMAMELRCSDLYRGLGECEQDCVYLRTLLVDMHSKIKLFTKDWEWENDKMICSTQTSVKHSLIPFDASYCKESCPGSNVPCHTCTFEDESEKPKAITCLSREDAMHTANLYCYLRGEKAGCKKLKCNTTYNTEATENKVISAKNEYSTSEVTNYAVGGELEVKGKGTFVEAGVNTQLDFQATIKSSFNLYTHEGATYNKRYFTKRNDGLLFECSEEMAIDDLSFDCQDLDALNIYPNAHSSCDEKYQKFSKCREYKMGDGRAFFNCSSEFAGAKILNNKSFAGANVDLILPIIGGGRLKVMGNHKYGWDVAETIMAESKQFNAGGLEMDHMQSTCKRWSEQWFKTSFENNPDKKWQANLVPSSWFESKEIKIPNSHRLRCTILENGSQKRMQINKIMTKLGYLNKDEVIEGKNGKQKRIKKEKVTQISYKLKPIRELTTNAAVMAFRGLNDYFNSEELVYPPKNAPIELNSFIIPFENRHLEYITQFHAGNSDKDLVMQFIDTIGEQKSNQFEISNCEYEPLSEKEQRRLEMMQYMYQLPAL